MRQAFAAAEAEIEDGVSPRVAPFVDVRDMGALLQRAGFALPVTDVDRLTVRYASPLALMHDLRRMGATNPLVERSRRPLKRATLLRMMEIYAERFSDPDGRVRATFEIVWLSGWAPHASQQKPLAPGSARQRLADALGRRNSAGEKAGGSGGQNSAATLSKKWRGRTEAETVAAMATPMPGDQGVFDRGRALLVGDEARRMSAWSSGGRILGLSFYWPSGSHHSSVVRWDTSGSSAGGIGYSRNRFGRTQRVSGLPAPSLSPPNAGRHRAASADGSPDRRGSRMSAARGTPR